MTYNEWRTICARAINPDLPLIEWSNMVNTISRAEITARKQQDWMERWTDAF